MMDKLTHFADYLRKIPAAFLVAIISVLALILFLPNGIAETLAVDIFRVNYRMYLGPALLLTTFFSIARVFVLRVYLIKKKPKRNAKIFVQTNP
jgi:hypothetical protein